jgi:predicted Zn-dependent protease
MQRALFTPLLLLFAFLASTAQAVGLLRDAEIERGLREIAAPVLQAAGLTPSRVSILIVDDPSLNAYVVNTRSIFIHAGLLMKLTRREQLQAIIGHEAAHIANGHLTRRPVNAQSARTASKIGLALSLAAGAASGSGAAAAGLALGSQSAAKRVFFGHTRAEESSADQSSVRFLVSAGSDPMAAVEVQEFFAGKVALNVSRQDPYMQSHPLTRDRIRALKSIASVNRGNIKPAPQLDAWFALVHGKLTAFERAPSWTLRKTKGKTDAISTMRQAVAYHRKPDVKRAVATINKLVQKQPNNPYVHELKGQILMESRQFGPAVQSYRRAAELAPRTALILGGYGRALLATKSQANTKAALEVLQKAYGRDGLDARILRDLGVAYARMGQNGMASLATAERYALIGRICDAGIHAQRASGLLSRGSASWQRAEDVIQTHKQNCTGKKRRRG